MTDEKLSIYASNPKHELVYELAVNLLTERARERENRANVEKQTAPHPKGVGEYRGTEKGKRRKGARWADSVGRKVAAWDDNAGSDAWRLHGA
jgi:hypothetical protein